MPGDEIIEESDIDCIRGRGGEVYTIENMGHALDMVGHRPVSERILLKSFLEDPSTYILCRSNKQVKKMQSLGFEKVSTIHQAKGLEYDNVVLIDFPITSKEELNVAYVGMTRAKNKLLLVDFEALLYNVCKHEITGASTKLF